MRKIKKTKKEKLIEELKKLPNPIVDKRHGISIFFEDSQARSNQTRFEHIALERHYLVPNDIRLIPKKIEDSRLIKDKEHKNGFNYYIKRGGTKNYIKVSIDIDKNNANRGVVKTIYVTNVIK